MVVLRGWHGSLHLRFGIKQKPQVKEAPAIGMKKRNTWFYFDVHFQKYVYMDGTDRCVNAANN